jgi:hypothetical protein
MGMDQYLLISFLVGWTSIYQLFWCELQGYKVLTHPQIAGIPGIKMQRGSSILNPSGFWTLLNDLAHDLQATQRVICRHRLTVRTNSDALSALSTGHSSHRCSFRA